MTIQELPPRHVERRGRRADRAHTPIQQLPWSQPRLTLEPSRIEDTIVVTKNGCEVLTPTPKTLTIVQPS